MFLIIFFCKIHEDDANKCDLGTEVKIWDMYNFIAVVQE